MASAHVLASLGARVVRPAHGTRPSVGEIAEAILTVGSSEVIVLPNDSDAFLAARHAAELTPLVEVVIIRTRNAAEGIVAALALDPGRPADRAGRADDARGRLAALLQRHHGGSGFGRRWQVAVRRGQVIAVDAARHVLAREESVEAALVQALAAMGRFELVTCYHGVRLETQDLERLRTTIGEAGWDAEVEIVPGGQRHEHLLVAVE